MNYIKMTKVALFVVITISLGLSISANQSSNSITSTISENNKVLLIMANNTSMLAQSIVDLKIDVNTLNVQVDRLGVKVFNLENSEQTDKTAQIQAVEARILLVETGLQALRDSTKEVPTHDSTRQFFELVLLDVQSIEQDIFHEEDVIYISGNAGATYQHSVSVKIRDSTNAVIYEASVGIPQDGRFTTAYIIAEDAELGRYTVSITDGLISDSIMFEVR